MEEDLLLEIEHLKKLLSEKINTENSLIASKTEYKKMVQYASEPIFSFNPDETYKYVNESFAKNLGLLPIDIIGKKPYDIFSHDEAEKRLNVVRKVFKSGEKCEIEVKIIDPNGKEFYFLTIADPIKDKQNKVIWVSCISKNITDQKVKAEESDKYFRSIFEQSPIMFWEQDYSSVKQYLDCHQQNGITDFIEFFKTNPKELLICFKKIKIIDVNNSVVETLQFPDKQTLLQNLFKTLTPNAINTFSLVLANVAQGDMYFEHTTDCKTYSGEIKHFYFKLFIPSEFKNSYSRVIAAMIDITALKNTEQELFIAKEKAEESDRLKTQFLLNMSHEIKTPMNAINGFSEMLNEPDLSDEKRKSLTSIIINSSNQLQSIVENILTISALETKVERINIQAVNINSIIADLSVIFRTKAFNNNISLYSKHALTDKQSEIYTDRTKIIQILTNLITNALKFTHEGYIEFGYNLKTDTVPAELEFYVKDTGIGIKPELHEKIFDRFTQVEIGLTRRYDGNGLGLSISKGFVELLGGKIDLQSELEKGSTFYFTIPYKPVNDIEKTNLSKKQNNSITTVLVAEDEEINFLFIELLLKRMDCKIIHAKDGQEAVDICKANSEIDVILMDIKMPIMDGHEAAKQIKIFRPDLIIIAQSAYTIEQYLEQYGDNPFDDYISKPIKKDELKQKIMKFIKK
ncbi:MAG: PAS domain-containing hybrid sensor histidine kinase/response regulator [Bacteroidales bacterium]